MVLEHPLVDRRLRRIAVELPPSVVVDTPDAWTLLSARRITAVDGAQSVVVHLASRVGIQWGLWRLDTGELLTGLHATGQLNEARLLELGVEQLTHTPVEETELQELRSVLQLDKALWSPRGPEHWAFPTLAAVGSRNGNWWTGAGRPDNMAGRDHPEHRRPGRGRRRGLRPLLRGLRPRRGR
ncbi:hypothetical protein [Quadrisphaera setariae]|uniref:hypothetical protein n=1 Tax=Quadrisphaera setariae TaxID=2593304 RepID=UPI00164F5F97|nr:hypothetical protein [Quadrisphaera setariae]